MTLPPQCEIFVEFAKLGPMICISLGIIFLRHLFFSIRRKETLRETVKKARTENTIFIFVFAINVCLFVQGRIGASLEKHFCADVKTIQRACRSPGVSQTSAQPGGQPAIGNNSGQSGLG